MRSGVRPKKRLSQNFLIDPNIAGKIVKSMNIGPHDHIVEIGPGEGILTKYLIESPADSITAIEKDDRLIPHLIHQFGHHGSFSLMHGDFLEIRIQELASREQPIRVIGNLPYHITSPILFQILQQKERIRDITVMVQQEVAERLAARPDTKAYGIPSVLFQTAGSIEILFHVSGNAFRPVPEVNSTVLRIAFFQTDRYIIKDWAFFQKLVRTAFNQRRKMLRNTLKPWISHDYSHPVPLTGRPEHLTVNDWVSLTNYLKEQTPVH